MRQTPKGSPGYLKAQKKFTFLRTALYFALSGSIFAIGFLTTKTSANLLTVVAVLGMLPASKSAVNMIMYLRTPHYDPEIQSDLTERASGLNVIYELYLTSYDKSYPVSALVVRNNTVCGFAEHKECNTEAAEKHISNILRQNSFQPTVKIFDHYEKFCARLGELSERKAEQPKRDGAIEDVIKAISL